MPPTRQVLRFLKPENYGRRIGAIHSFGCGKAQVRAARVKASLTEHETLLDWVEKMCLTRMDCDYEHHKVEELLSLVEPQASYVRLQTPITDVQPFESDLEPLAKLKMDTRD